MTTTNIPPVVGFAAGLSTVGFTLLNSDGTVQTARSTTGVSEVSTGVYGTTETVDSVDLPLIVRWDDGISGEAFAEIEVDKFEGMTSLPNWLRAALRSDTADPTALSEINADIGNGVGGFDAASDSLEAMASSIIADGVSQPNQSGTVTAGGTITVTQYSDYAEDTDVDEIGPVRVVNTSPIQTASLLFGATKRIGRNRYYSQDVAGKHIQGTARAVPVSGEADTFDIYISIAKAELGLDKEPGDWGWDVDAVFPDSDSTPVIERSDMILLQSMGDREDRA